jgi:hypothetical protein
MSTLKLERGKVAYHSINGRKYSTAILTETPIKDQLEKEKMATDAKTN